jgi:hypothetical protein
MAAQQTKCIMNETKTAALASQTESNETVLRTNIRNDQLHAASKGAYLLQS